MWSLFLQELLCFLLGSDAPLHKRKVEMESSSNIKEADGVEMRSQAAFSLQSGVEDPSTILKELKIYLCQIIFTSLGYFVRIVV
ncbi:tubby-like protein 4 isoform X1 [Iris pallida]|uniref:Tubby-like protein 4 isoform X1 n=1 Tax=Iris pallida TaxID=29817 RepID=A0AAX6GES8_IRIPA|nr:tubby-like protein 4 isoform X1 [Iris pallida]